MEGFVYFGPTVQLVSKIAPSNEVKAALRFISKRPLPIERGYRTTESVRPNIVRSVAVARLCSYSIKVEYADRRKIRERNKTMYRLAHWPIWIWVFFLAPGPLTFSFVGQAGGM
jgi:hypothetical protein